MSTTKISLTTITVASPCTAPWDEMHGDDRKRFCDQCAQNVYNLSELSHEDAEALITSHEGRLCIRYFRRFDGTIMTKDCPVGLRAIKQRMVLIGGAAAAILFSVLAFCTVGVFASGVGHGGGGQRFRNPIQVIRDIISPPVVAGEMCPIPAPPPPPAPDEAP